MKATFFALVLLATTASAGVSNLVQLSGNVVDIGSARITVQTPQGNVVTVPPAWVQSQRAVRRGDWVTIRTTAADLKKIAKVKPAKTLASTR